MTSANGRFALRARAATLQLMTDPAGIDTAPRRRGRPREFDRNDALDAAMHVFHTRGYAAASLDDLAGAMGMSRPSLYNAFGNKQAIYRQAFDHFRSMMRREMTNVFDREGELRVALENFYRTALGVYLASEPAPGCFVFCTAPVETVTHAEIRDDLRSVLDEVDEALAAQFSAAQRAGSFPRRFDPKQAARIAQAVLHSLALRARAGESKETLEAMIGNAVALLCAGDH